MLPELSEIAKRRRKSGLKQTELAKLAGVSQSLITKIEKGLTDPGYSKAKDIFGALEQIESRQTLKAGDIFTKSVIRISRTDKISEAAGVMKRHNISQLPVFDKGVLVGGISEETLTHALASGKSIKDLGRSRVGEIMEEPFPILPETTHFQALTKLLEHSKALLISKKGKIQGIITKADLLKTVQ